MASRDRNRMMKRQNEAESSGCDEDSIDDTEENTDNEESNCSGNEN